jgi:FAD synthase
MKPTLFGQVDRPAVAVVGVWDPLLPRHTALCTALAASARERSLASVVIVLHPNPPALIIGDRYFPTYDDVHARVWRLRACGVDAVLMLRMTRADTARGAAAFFDSVLTAVPLAELWLGERQTLGRGPEGAPCAIADLAAMHGVRLRVLPPPPAEGAGAAYQALTLLAGGRLAEAIAYVGHPPVWRRPRSGVLPLPWRPGRYRAVPLSHPGEPANGAEITVSLRSRARGRPALLWPDPQTRYLAFVGGVADEPLTPAASR